jgi:DNA (cytosine-5)-methyltransferase 1
LEGMGDVAGISKESLRLAKRNRVGRLKGYGNAIVPQVAAVFIRAFLESIPPVPPRYTSQ